MCVPDGVKGRTMSTKEPKLDGKILSLIRKRPVTPTPALDKIERYWNVVRGNRLVPSRVEIDPRGLEGALGHTFILERITGGLARFRIAGSQISEITGLELRQMPVSALFSANSRDILSEALIAVFEDPACIKLRIESRGGFGRETLTGEMMLLPLRSDTGQIDRVLGGISLNGKIGRTPRRLDILGQSRQTLVGYAGPEETNAFTNPPLHAERPPLGAAPGNFARRRSDPQPRLGGAHLKLVVDND